MPGLQVADAERHSSLPAHNAAQAKADAAHVERAGNGESEIELEAAPSAAADELDKDSPNYSQMDGEVAKYASGAAFDISSEENARLRRLIDRRVLIVMIATYFLQALDKGTLNFSSIMHLPRDTAMTWPAGSDRVTQEYNWLTTCIYVTILVVEYPQNFIISKVPVAKYLSFSIVAWGVVLGCHAACHNFTGLVIVRTLLGLFESACQPAFVVLSSMWYRRDEQAARVTYWYMMNGAQQIVGGLLAYCFSLISGEPLKSWQWLFLSYSVLSVLFGLFVGWWMPDSPMRAKCFSEADKRLMVERVRDNQTGLQNRTFKKHQVLEALRDPHTWCYAVIQLCTTLPTSGLGAFANLIINGTFGFSVLQTQLLSMVLGFYIILVLLASLWIVNRFRQNTLTMLGFVLPSVVGTVLLMTIPADTLSHKIGLLICYYITLSFWSAQTLGLSMMSRNTGGQTKKTVVVAINFIAWSVGNAVGAQVFLAKDAPRYFTAFATHLACYALLVATILFFRCSLLRENRRRDELAAAGLREAKDEKMVHSFDDLTDRENLNFRYVY